MKKTKKTHKRMMDGGMAAMTRPAFDKGRGPMTKPAFDKGQPMMTKPAFDKGQAMMTKPAFNKGQAIMGDLPEAFGGARSSRTRVARPSVIGARPPGGKFILPQQPNTIGTGNGPDYQSGYSEGPRGGRGGYSGADRGERVPSGSRVGQNLQGFLSSGIRGAQNPFAGVANSETPMAALQGPTSLRPSLAGKSPSTSMNGIDVDALRGNRDASQAGLASVAGALGGGIGMKKGGAVKGKKMRGGGLARKGVGMALAKGGLAKRAGGCAKRGVGRGKIV